MSHYIENPQQEHHTKCQDECDLQSGPMLKCLNPRGKAGVPCQSTIHVSCAGFDKEVAKFLATYYCTDCTTSNEVLHIKMDEAEQVAKLAFRKCQRELESRAVVSLEEHEKLKKIAVELDAKLREKISIAKEKEEENKALQEQVDQQAAEILKLKTSSAKREQEFSELLERIKNLEEFQNTTHQSSNETHENTPHNVSNMSPTSLFQHFEHTLHQAEGVDESEIDQKPQRPSSSRHSASNIAANIQDITTWPNYAQQAAEAKLQGEQTLMLVRASLAKPQIFEGDVTKWSTFLSEFIRTSLRGHYRDFEDMDRLRDLIRGDAREMFLAELSDPCADAINTLKRLDDFFGVKGNAVRVSLERVTQMGKVDKPSNRDSIIKLYTNIKHYVLQCRVHRQEHELSSQATLFILESKMCADHALNWRAWAKNNNRLENVDGIIAYLEEQIRELNFLHTKPLRTTIKAAVHTTTEVTGGPGKAEISTTGRGDDQGNQEQKSRGRNNSRRGRGGKNSRRYANCPCFLCKEKHPFYVCPQFTQENVQKRLEIVKRLHICTRCLSNDKHKAEDCPNKLLRCYEQGCQVKNTHPKLHNHASQQSSATVSHIDLRHDKTVSHYAMVPGHVVGRDGQQIFTTIMWDTGSGISLASEEIFRKAKYESRTEYELTLHWATSVTHTESDAKLFDLKFRPLGYERVITLEGLTAVRELDLPAQAQNADDLKQSYPHLRNVPLQTYELQKPQILLGLPHNHLTCPISTVQSDRMDSPSAILTKLGWFVLGNKRPQGLCRPIVESNVMNFICCERLDTEISNDQLLKYIHRYNQLESIGITHADAPLLSAEDQKAAEIIKETMRFDENQQRYEIGLLWAKKDDTMPDNYSEALIRLQSTERRLKKLNMVDFVHQQFTQQIADGLLVEVSREEANKYPRRNYVYGFLTFNQNKDPPKPRWVNDTAAKWRGISLNSRLLKGPDSLVPLPLAMCSLREGKIAFQADVKSMFNQVALKKEDQFSQLTLWRNCKTNEAPSIYRQTRVIFGPTCSPAVTSAVRIHHARACAHEFSNAADIAEHQMYVDDVPESCDTVEEAIKTANDLIIMFKRINWPLVEFQSNSQELLNNLPSENVSKKTSALVSNDEDEYVTKILGISWKPREDVYVFRLNDSTMMRKCAQEGYMPTKKEMLGIVMRFFDPTGMISPFRIRGHIIMQRVWKAGTDWKKKPPKEICEEFASWLRDFEIVTKLQIPRSYSLFSLKECELSLHVFVDAGSEAYAACVYLLIKHNEQINVRLVASKARVAPVKYVSIPRLELMAALLGARLLNAVKTWHRRLKIEDCVCWTDSEVVYKWIRAQHLPRTAFTAPRISEIHELTSADKWYYVPTDVNVADFATKCRKMDYSNANHEWYVGPKFLYGRKEDWPKQKNSECYPIDAITMIVKPLKSAKPLLAGVMTQISAKVRGNWINYVQIVARALRFVDYLRPNKVKHRQTGWITSSEFQRAESFIIGQAQRAVYPSEFERLREGKAVLATSPIAPLSPMFCEKTNTIRATTRLSESFPYSMRRPLILPCFHEITDAITDYHHKIQLHVGENAIIASIRTRVWILNARRAVRRCRARCIKCIEENLRAKIPEQADLPDFRFDINQKPFFHTGMDLFGPIKIYSGRSKLTKEVHVVIFTCMVTRAVYLEVVDDQSTGTFLVAFNKLWTRRGPISHAYSDNGRNFLGASGVLEADSFQKWLGNMKIKWHFIPAFTPQFGGTWERLIKDIKRGLQASIGKFIVSRPSLELTLAQIELNLNNRPLTEVPLSSMDETPITPYLLMTGYPNYPICDESAGPALNEDVNLMKMKMAGRVNALVQSFRSRFVREYAPIIARRTGKSKSKNAHLKINDYVVYMDPTKNPSQWKRGIIVKTYPGRDNKVRVADVKLKSGEIISRRSIYRLAKIDLRRENIAAEQNKYEAALNLLKSRAEYEFSRGMSDENRKVNKTMRSHVNFRIFDDSTKAKSLGVRRWGKMKEDEIEKFFDAEGTRSIYVKNLPATLGFSEIFEVMAEFGKIASIVVTRYTGDHAFNAIVCYHEQASVSTALLFNESQLITVCGKAHKQFFERLAKPLELKKCLKSPHIEFVEFTNEYGIKQTVVVVQEGSNRGDSIRKMLPLCGNESGFINYCPRTHRYDFTVKEVDVKDEAIAIYEIPFVLKSDTARVNVLAAGPHDVHANGDSARLVRNKGRTIVIRKSVEDPFQPEKEARHSGKTDLRQVINHRREARRIQSIIIKPPKRLH